MSQAEAQLTRFASVADKPLRWPWEHHQEPPGGKETDEALNFRIARWEKETERRLARVRGLAAAKGALADARFSAMIAHQEAGEARDNCAAAQARANEALN